MWPIEHTLDTIEPMLSPVLVDAAAFGAARGLLGRLADVATDFYFETRLGAEQGNVDLACRVPANEGRPSQLRSAELLCRIAAARPEWAGVHAFVQRWREPLPVAEPRWLALWLGFDDVNTAALVAPPCVSLELSPKLSSAAALASAEATAPVFEAIELLLDAPIAAAARRRIDSTLRCLPASARVVYISAMLPRAERPLKFTIQLPRQDVLGTLDALRWEGPRSEIQELLGSCCPALDPVRLDLTLSEAGQRRVGIELLSKGLRQSRHDAEAVLAQLQQRGQCLASKREALGSWWGHSTERYPTHGFDSCLARTWYAKWCCVEGEQLHAKVYLGFAPRPLSLALLEETHA